MGDAKGISFNGKPAEGDGTKVSFLDELLDLLKKLLERFLCCVTCGCYPKPRDDQLHVEVYEAELMEEERDAVSDLLKYLDSGEKSSLMFVNYHFFKSIFSHWMIASRF